MNLNSAMRRAICESVMNAYDNKMNFEAKNGEGLFKETSRRGSMEIRERYKRDLILALMTFDTLEDLKKKWPRIFIYMPLAIIDPVNSIQLP